MRPEVARTRTTMDRRGAGAARRIVFVGNPNAGKTTLFNRLTGLRAKTANHGGTTVEIRRGPLAGVGGNVELVDLPGLYALDAETPDERVAAQFLDDALAEEGSSLWVVLVVDATQLTRNLYLAGQIRERVPRLLVVLNMSDVATRRGLAIDTEALSREIDAPVMAVSARTGAGVRELRQWLSDPGEFQPGLDCPATALACPQCRGCPHAARFAWAEEVSRKVSAPGGRAAPGRVRRHFDQWSTHPVAGLFVFAAIMGGLFQSLFWLAEHPMGWIEDGFGMLAEFFGGRLGGGLGESFLLDGVIAGLGGTLVFLPQIVILFFLLALLEDSGYLARASFVIDRWMSRLGLPGKAFIPMLSAHACAIPAVMGARSIRNTRDRLVTILVLPFLTCSARLPVYALVTAMLFANRPGLAGAVFTGAYFMGIGATLGTAWLLRRSLLPGKTAPLVIELPHFHRPGLRNALVAAADRGGLFLRRAGTVILGISVLLWALGSFPRLETAADAGAGAEIVVGEETALERQMEQSIIGGIGKAVQPVFAPLGFDWKVTVAVLTSFAAREVVVSSLSVLHGLGAAEADEAVGLAERLHQSVPPATAWSLLVFFILALQCFPTLVVVGRETNSWKWPLLQFGFMFSVAYAAAWITHVLALRVLVG